MADPMEKIAEAINTGKELAGVKAELAQLHTVVAANLGEQQRLNNRMDQTVGQLVEGLRDTRERLVCVEEAVKQIPKLHTNVDELRTQLAKYVGKYTALAFVASVLFTLAFRKWGM